MYRSGEVKERKGFLRRHSSFPAFFLAASESCALSGPLTARSTLVFFVRPHDLKQQSFGEMLAFCSTVRVDSYDRARGPSLQLQGLPPRFRIGKLFGSTQDHKYDLCSSE